MKLRRFSSRQRWTVVGVLLVVVWVYTIWSPGLDVRDGRHDRSANGIWMQHGWLGDDAWFERNGKKASLFRDEVRIRAMAELLRKQHIRDVFVHLCPCSSSGEIAPADAEQAERFLDGFGGFRVLPWVGGVRGASARVDDAAWRERFVESCGELLMQHPRLAGVHVNIEPMPSGDADFFLLLEELRRRLPAGKIISVAAYPPPTVWHRFPDVHWDESYSRAVASRIDQSVVMMYDTSLHSPRLYQKLMKDWTREVLAWYAASEVLLGIPAYEDPGVGYHDPATENLDNALLGIHAGLAAQGEIPADYAGVSIYCEWEMTPAKWETFTSRFCRQPGTQPQVEILKATPLSRPD